MRSILEQSIVHHLNGETDKAQELFHKFVVAKARQIHESMRLGEDPLAEGWDSEITSEEYFTEEDLADLEDGEEGAHDAEADAADADVAADDAEADAADADVDAADDFGGAEDETADLGAGGDLEDEIADLKAELEDLKNQFADILGDDGDEAEGDDFADHDFGGDDVATDDASDDDFGADDVEDNFDDDMADDAEDHVKEADESDEASDDEFDRMTESVIDELAKIEAHLEDGKEAGAGKSFEQNRKGALPNHGVKDRMDGAKPIRTKNTTHTTFERETAPSVAKMKGKRRNALSKSTDTLSDVKAPKPQDGKEAGASGKSITQNRKSPLSGLNRS